MTREHGSSWFAGRGHNRDRTHSRLRAENVPTIATVVTHH